VLGLRQQLLELREGVVELVVAERREVVARRVHGRDVRLAVVLRREGRPVGVVSDVHQPDGNAAALLLRPDLLRERRAPRDAANVPADREAGQFRAGRHDCRIAERQQVAVRVVRMEDGQARRGSRLRQGGSRKGQGQDAGGGNQAFRHVQVPRALL